MKLKIDPKTASVSVNETLQFKAETPEPQLKVLWSVSGSAGGKIDAKGLYRAGYRAGTDSVTASVDGSVLDTATVTVTS